MSYGKKQWMLELAYVDNEDVLDQIVYKFCDYVYLRYFYTSHKLLDYHRDLRDFIDSLCKYGHVFTEKIAARFYEILGLCADMTIYRKMFTHGMKISVGELDYLSAYSTGELAVLTEADEMNIYVKSDIGHMLGRISLTETTIDTTIWLSFLIEA